MRDGRKLKWALGGRMAEMPREQLVGNQDLTSESDSNQGNTVKVRLTSKLEGKKYKLLASCARLRESVLGTLRHGQPHDRDARVP